MRDTDRSPTRLKLNQKASRERQPMTIAFAIVVSSMMLTVGLIVGSFFIGSKSVTPRYQLVNVGNGDTHRIDRQTGDVSLCYSEGCAPLETISSEGIVWDKVE